METEERVASPSLEFILANRRLGMNTQDRFNRYTKKQWLALMKERTGKPLAEQIRIDQEIALLRASWQEQFAMIYRKQEH